MPYIKKKISDANDEKAYQILISLGYKMKEAQSLIDKGRLFCGDEILSKNSIVNGEIFLIQYDAKPKGLRPIFEDENFAVFDKPSGVLTHPNGRNCDYSMNDEIIHMFGKNAKVAHRLDKETSGVLLVAKNLKVEKAIKSKFENGEIHKSYLALVSGIVSEDFVVNQPLSLKKEAKILKNKVFVSQDGKEAMTKFEVIKIYNDLNVTLLKCIPLTGRQHQIRVHMFHVKHSIIGDTLYGVSDEFACRFLDGLVSENERLLVTKANRLLLHAQNLSFIFENKIYDISSKFNAKNEFEKLIYGVNSNYL